ncbi:ROK family protein [Propioniciclava tarda]|uniref:ROK family protein n=1 Tax=Propioniciclava tarda TaxID=433330 RepID=UPI00116A08A8|nr:ROK family protein [Propioniciclava tarda]SMO75099.1 IclR helix-turn-helix domain-containing protein [Propioniciclava tarda]
MSEPALSATQSTLRELNLALVARAAFARPGELTRADIAATTGMTRSTASRLVDELLESGVLVENAPVKPTGRGLGVGSAFVFSGEVFSGRHGWAGELGHVCVDPSGAICGCGAQGCLETIAGRGAILAAAGRDDWDALVADAAAPDAALGEVLGRVGRALGIALAGTLNLLDVSHVTLGGTLADLAPALIPTLVDELNARVLSAPFDAITVETVATAETGAALGAAYAGAQVILTDPARWASG